MEINTYDNLKKATSTKMRTKDGFLSAYAFACGYIEIRDDNKTTIQLYKEHGLYHVEAIRYDPVFVFRTNGKVWESYITLKEAKAMFFKLCTKYKLNKINNNG